VYAALLDAAALERWLAPDGMVGAVHELDARPGGRFRMTLTYLDPTGAPGKSSVATDVVDATFGALVADELVEWLVRFVSDDPDLAGVMRLSWLLESADGGTVVTVRAENVPPGVDAQAHAAGLRPSLANLADHLSLG